MDYSIEIPAYALADRTSGLIPRLLVKFGGLLDRRLNQMRWNTLINDQVVQAIIDSTPDYPAWLKERV